MKILIIGNFGFGWDGSICDEEHIAKALEDLGHNVDRHSREQLIIPFKKNGDYDFTLIAQWDGYSDEFIEHLPKPLIYWAFDYQDKGQDWHERLVNKSDLYLSKPFSDSFHNNWRWCAQDFAPQFLDKAPTVEQDIDVLFTGSWVPWESGKERVEVLRAIEAAGFNLQINSVTADKWREEGFKNVHGPVMDDQLPPLIARAKINFSMDHVYAPGYWSDRNAQIMACGGFVLFRYVPFSEAIFRSNIAYFYDVEDCLEAVRYWLENDEDRGMIAAQGYEWSIAYKAKERVADMLNIVREIL